MACMLLFTPCAELLECASPLALWASGLPCCGAIREWFVKGGVDSAVSNARAKAAEDSRTYSSSKVIHRWRGGLLVHPPQPAVNNFGSGEKDICEQNPFLPDHVVEHAGPGRRIPHSNVETFSWRCSLRALRLVVKEYSEPFARKCKPAETNSYKSFFAAGPACSQTHQPQTI